MISKTPAKINIENCYFQPIYKEPIEPKDISKDDTKKDSDPRLGFFIWLTISIFFYFLYFRRLDFTQTRPLLIWTPPPLLALFAKIYILKEVREWRSKKIAIKRNKQAIFAAEKKAKEYTKSAINDYTTSFRYYESLINTLESIHWVLEKAKKEYKSNAFSLYWDNIEEAVYLFSEFQNELKAITWKAKSYNATLANGHKNNFPKFPVGNEVIPKMEPYLLNFSNTLRLGQTNYKFASIWEQRKTREVLILGFKTIDEAIKNIDTSISSSLKEALEILNLK